MANRRKDEAFRALCRERDQHSKAKLKANDPESYRRRARGYKLKADHGITLEEFEGLAIEQKNQCAICATKTDDLHVDHCHASKHIRGLLCHSCNVGLGHFRDDPELLLRAITYLKTP